MGLPPMPQPQPTQLAEMPQPQSMRTGAFQGFLQHLWKAVGLGTIYTTENLAKCKGIALHVLDELLVTLNHALGQLRNALHLNTIHGVLAPPNSASSRS